MSSRVYIYIYIMYYFLMSLFVYCIFICITNYMYVICKYTYVYFCVFSKVIDSLVTVFIIIEFISI